MTTERLYTYTGLLPFYEFNKVGMGRHWRSTSRAEQRVGARYMCVHGAGEFIETYDFIGGDHFIAFSSRRAQR